MIEDFLRQYPKTSASTYARVLASFLARSKHDLEHATAEDVIAYHAAIIDQAPASVGLKLAVLSTFFAYQRRRGVRKDDPMGAIARRPKVQPLKAARWLDEADQRKVLDAINDEDPHAARDRVLVWLLLHGLRVSEAVNLEIEGYRYGLLTFEGKGAKTRSVPVLRPAALAIDAYIGRRRSGPLVRGPNGHLSVRRAQYIINTITLRALGTRMNTHSMRHSFVTRHVKAGTPLAQVAALAGHATTQTTQRYTHLDDSDLRLAMANDPLNESGELTVIDGGVRATG